MVGAEVGAARMFLGSLADALFGSIIVGAASSVARSRIGDVFMKKC